MRSVEHSLVNIYKKLYTIKCELIEIECNKLSYKDDKNINNLLDDMLSYNKDIGDLLVNIKNNEPIIIKL